MAARSGALWLFLAGGVALGAATIALGGRTRIIDVRDKAKNARYKSSGTLKRARKRDIEDVTGIVLHQVGVGKPGQSSSVGTAAYPKMTAHLAVHHNGDVYYIHPFDTYLYHGHGLNAKTIGIEVAGLFSSDHELPDAQARGLRTAIAFAKSEAARQGAKITEIWAHRQSSSDRGADPGRSIWQKGALSSGLKRRVLDTVGSGKAIPSTWDPLVAAVMDAEGLDAAAFEIDEAMVGDELDEEAVG